MYKRENFLIALIYIVWGAFLFFTVPMMDSLYGELYPEWDTSSLLQIRAFHFPDYIWLIAFSSVALIIYFTSRFYKDKHLRRINVTVFIFFILVAFVSFDWLTGFILCHEWGCSKILPIF